MQELMFNSSGPLGPFSTKIRLAYLMGLISGEFFKNLEIMREIRNRFAHHTEIGSFANPKIASRCANFTIVDKYATSPNEGVYGDPSALFNVQVSGAAQKLTSPKDRYVLSAQIFSIGLQHATVNAKAYTPAF